MQTLRHTFLFQPARWEAEGTFTDGTGEIFPVEGFSLVLHADSHWFVEGKMRLRGNNPVEIVNNYIVVPFPENDACTTWSSQNPALGRLNGQFVAVGDTLFSTFASRDGHYNGSEWLRQIDAATYENRGILLTGNRLLSAWALNLQRQN